MAKGRKCRNCKGTGRCQQCDGDVLVKHLNPGLFDKTDWVVCDMCETYGTCWLCGGTGGIDQAVDVNRREMDIKATGQKTVPNSGLLTSEKWREELRAEGVRIGERVGRNFPKGHPMFPHAQRLKKLVARAERNG